MNDSANNDMGNGSIIAHWATGVGVLIGGITISTFQSVNVVLQTAGLVVALCISGVTLYRLVRGKK